jgi:antirestriction protein ArdC
MPGSISKAFNAFHRYSFLNMLLVFMQTGKAEPMGNYNSWKRKGRNVIKGQKALFVNHPKPVYKRDEQGNVVRDEDGKAVIAFVSFIPKATVFQLHQTEGPDLVYPDLPDWDKDQALANLAITEVPFTEGDGNIQGYAFENKLAMNPVAAHPMATMIHEMAHIVLGHTAKDKAADYAQHRGVMEFQAEATALLVCKELDVPGYVEAESRGYIQHWLGCEHGASDYVAWDEDAEDSVLVEDSTITAIFNTVDKILVAGRKAHYEKLAEAEQAAAE